MQAYLVRRLLQIVPVFIGITFVSFLIIRLSPGDPIATLFPPELLGKVDQALLREQLGLNDPLPVQYVKMMGNFFNGTLFSFQEKRPVFDMVLERLPTTIPLTLLAVTLALVIGLPIALLAATRPYSFFDAFASTGVLIGLSLPQFWIAEVLILVFSEWLRLLPASGIRPIDATSFDLRQMVAYLLMPTIVLTLSLLPSIIRYTRSSLLEVLHQDYIRTARSKGLRSRAVILGHALRNALIPAVSLIGAVFPVLLGEAVIVETVFGLPGLGRLAIRAAQNRDFPLVLTVNMFCAFMVLLSNLITDLIYTYLDPRIRLG